MDKSEAYKNGWLAHKNYRENGNTNPYHECSQPYSFQEWANGWCDRFSAVKHDLDLSFDKE